MHKRLDGFERLIVHFARDESKTRALRQSQHNGEVPQGDTDRLPEIPVRGIPKESDSRIRLCLNDPHVAPL